MNFETPILYLIFNRPSATKESFEYIKKIKPKNLYVAADGPRIYKLNEKEKCEETRKIISDNIDWECNLHTLYRDENLGCGKSVSEAITWFFNNVEYGIILEDDIIPSIDFFHFSTEMLQKYRFEDKVMLISAMNFLSPNLYEVNNSYVFSKYTPTWGWATWRRAWDGYDYFINGWEDKNHKQDIFAYLGESQFRSFSSTFDQVCKVNLVDTWDYQWWYHVFINKGFGIIPKYNLAKNIGFNSDATHTFDMDPVVKNIIIKRLELPLVHPKDIKIDDKFDEIYGNQFYNLPKQSNLNFLSINKIKQILTKLYVKDLYKWLKKKFQN